MTTHTMFTPNGDGYDISPAGVVLIIAGVIYGDPSETSAKGMRRATALLERTLTAARAGRFTQGDILRTLLARNQPDHRVMVMVQAACDAAGAAAMSDALQELSGRGANDDNN